MIYGTPNTSHSFSFLPGYLSVNLAWKFPERIEWVQNHCDNYLRVAGDGKESRNSGLGKDGKVKSSWAIWGWKKFKNHISIKREERREFLKLLMVLICLFSLERQADLTLQDVMGLSHFPAVLWIFCHVTSPFSFVLFFGIPFPPPQAPR